MEKSWIHYIKVYEDKIIEYALQYALLKRHHCMYDVQKKAFISYGISDAEDMADLQIDLIRQEANHLLTSRAVLPFFGLIQNDADLMGLDEEDE